MYSKATVFGHPIHPMLVAYPLALYPLTLVAYVVFWFGGGLLWFHAAVVANIAGVSMAVLASLPGLLDWLLGIPRGTPAKRLGRRHLLWNLAALVLFGSDAGVHLGQWVAAAPDAGWGSFLALLGVGCTIAADCTGWTLVQTYHIGVALTREQRLLEPDHTPQPDEREVRAQFPPVRIR